MPRWRSRGSGRPRCTKLRSTPGGRLRAESPGERESAVCRERGEKKKPPVSTDLLVAAGGRRCPCLYHSQALSRRHLPPVRQQGPGHLASRATRALSRLLGGGALVLAPKAPRTDPRSSCNCTRCAQSGDPGTGCWDEPTEAGSAPRAQCLRALGAGRGHHQVTDMHNQLSSAACRLRRE